MRKLLILSTTLILLAVSFYPAGAAVFEFQPNSNDLYDLDHHYYYRWGINFTLPAGETIVEATLDFDDIRNWDDNSNILYVHLLNSAATGVKWWWDNQGGGDNFAGQGIELFTWTDLPDYAQDLSYSFSEEEIDTLMTFLGDGNFGLGFDPDCHFWNNDITLRLQTNDIPEPASLILVLTGLAGLAIGRRKKQ